MKPSIAEQCLEAINERLIKYNWLGARGVARQYNGEVFKTICEGRDMVTFEDGSKLVVGMDNATIKR